MATVDGRIFNYLARERSTTCFDKILKVVWSGTFVEHSSAVSAFKVGRAGSPISGQHVQEALILSYGPAFYIR
jgi:hypothetical protein